MLDRTWTSRLLLVAILGLALGGAAISGELLKRHAGDIWSAGGEAGAGVLSRACQAVAAWGLDCATGGSARGFELRVPVPWVSAAHGLELRAVKLPLAFIGLAYFVTIGAWFALLGRPRPSGRAWYLLPQILAILGAVISVVLLIVMAVGLASRCVLCVLVHAVSLALSLAVWRLCRRAAWSEKALARAGAAPRRVANLTLTGREVGRVGLVALAAVGALWFYWREELALRNQIRKLVPYRSYVVSLQEDAAFLWREYQAQPLQEIPAGGDVDPDHVPRLVAFIDYRCGPCACTLARLERHLAATPVLGSIEIRHFPLEYGGPEPPDPGARLDDARAADAVEAARLQGGDEAFGRMHALLLRERRPFTAEVYRALAETCGLDGAQLLRDMDDPRVQRVVAEHVALARAWGVTGTPALFLDGRRVPEICDTPVFWQFVGRSSSGDGGDLAHATDALAGPPAPREPGG